MKEEKTLTLNWDFCLKISLLVVFVYFLYLIKDLLIWIIFALVLSILFNFVIDFLQQKKIPRAIATILTYFSLLILIGAFFYWTAPVFLSEIRQFNVNFPDYIQKISPFTEKIGIELVQPENSFFGVMENNLEKAGKSIFSALTMVFGGLQAFAFIIFLAFFFSLERNLLERVFANFSPIKYKDYLFNLLPRVRKRVSGWFVSRIIGVIFVALLTYLVLFIFNVKYAFILALFAGVLDFVPIVGPIIAAVLITSLVMLNSLSQAAFVLIGFVIIQQLENNLLFPLLFKRFMDLPPFLVLISLAIGGKLWGFMGAILAIPLIGVIFELLKDYLVMKRNRPIAEASENEAF